MKIQNLFSGSLEAFLSESQWIDALPSRKNKKGDQSCGLRDVIEKVDSIQPCTSISLSTTGVSSKTSGLEDACDDRWWCEWWWWWWLLVEEVAGDSDTALVDDAGRTWAGDPIDSSAGRFLGPDRIWPFVFCLIESATLFRSSPNRRTAVRNISTSSSSHFWLQTWKYDEFVLFRILLHV